jgi:AraC family transcriptional regulator
MKQEFNKPLINHTLKTNRTCAGLMLSESLYPSRLRQPRHTHELASFSFVLNGNYIENYERKAETRVPSTVVFHPPQESHSVEYLDKSVRILSVQFDFKRLKSVREHSTILDSPAVGRSQTLNWLCKRLYQEFRRMDALSPMAIEGLILEILVEASRNKTEATGKEIPRWLTQAKEYVHTHFAESFTLDDLARTIGVHPVYLARVFREKFGCTIGEYVRKLRLEFASRQISASDFPLSEIAAAAGFSDQSHLTKIFKTYYGVTPSEYRKLFRSS